MPTEINSGQSPVPNSKKGVGQVSGANSRNQVEAEENQVADAPESPRGDTVSISQTGQQLQSLESSVRKEPEVREALVNAIKQQVDNGTYEVDSRKLATAIKEYESILAQ